MLLTEDTSYWYDSVYVCVTSYKEYFVYISKMFFIKELGYDER